MKIHAAVRLNNEVYLPDNDEHASLLADRLNDRQKIRLAESGAISGPGSEVEGVTHERTTVGAVDNTGGVITKAPSKKKKVTKKKAAPKVEKPAVNEESAEADPEKPKWGAGDGDPSS